MLPLLTAALIGAAAAGTATLMSTIDGPGSAGPTQVALSAADADGSSGGLSRPGSQMGANVPEPSDQGSDASTGTTTKRPATSQSAAPPRKSEASEPTSSETSLPTTSTPPQEKVEDEVVDLVNAERAKAGCDPLQTDPMLAQAAQDHSTDMAQRDYFDHTTPEGLTFAERIVNSGYPTPGAENIARGQKTPKEVMTSWMESDGHRANILNCDLDTIGVGLDENGMYWTQDFGY